MTRYVLGRIVTGLLTLFLFLTAMFFLVNALIPGDFVTSLGPLPGDVGQGLREELGVDQPLVVQYFRWVGGLITLDLGTSYEGSLGFGLEPGVWDQIRGPLATTLVVLSIGLSIAFLLGGWLGRTAGYTNSSLLGGTLTFVSVLFLTTFPPALAVALEQGLIGIVGGFGVRRIGILEETVRSDDVGRFGPADFSVPEVLWRVFFVFAVTLAALWLVQWGYGRLTRKKFPRVVFLAIMVAVPLLLWREMGIHRHVLDLAGTLALLIFAVVLLTFGEVLLVTRAAMDDVMLEDYVMAARAKGMPEKMVRDRHAARTALLPVLSRFVVAVPYFLTGLVILEIVFGGTNRGGGTAIVGVLQEVSAPAGLGTVLFRSVTDQDVPLLLGALLVVGVITVVLRVILDIAHALLDPRVRFTGVNVDSA